MWYEARFHGDNIEQEDLLNALRPFLEHLTINTLHPGNRSELKIYSAGVEIAHYRRRGGVLAARDDRGHWYTCGPDGYIVFYFDNIKKRVRALRRKNTFVEEAKNRFKEEGEINMKEKIDMRDPELMIKLYPDGNQWCALLGEDIQSGRAGFGEGPKEALNALMKEKVMTVIVPY